VRLNEAARELIGAGANATIITVGSTGAPHVSVVWVGLDSSASGDDLVIAHLGEHAKVRNIRRNPFVTLTIIDTRHWHGYVRPYLKVTGTASIEEGGAPELLARLRPHAGNPDTRIVFPPPDAPAGFITRVHIENVGGTGPWRDTAGTSRN
jgi:PPOX class probable F420-dependent enzyme